MFQNAGRIVTVQGVSSSASVGTEVNVILRVGCASVPQDGGDHSARNPVLKVTLVSQCTYSSELLRGT